VYNIIKQLRLENKWFIFIIQCVTKFVNLFFPWLKPSVLFWNDFMKTPPSLHFEVTCPPILASGAYTSFLIKPKVDSLRIIEISKCSHLVLNNYTYTKSDLSLLRSLVLHEIPSCEDAWSKVSLGWPIFPWVYIPGVRLSSKAYPTFSFRKCQRYMYYS